jgi:predicted DCC family thiol-disulfide oxidoreductase YuxK
MAAVPQRAATLVYDGACPFCSKFAQLTRIRQALGTLELVDARAGGAVVEAVRKAGYDLDAGMVLLYGGRHYHGADCLHMLALLSTRVGPFNHVLARLFRSPGFSRRCYPWLRAARNATLTLAGRDRLR